MAIIEQIKLLEDDKGVFIEQLEQSRKFYTGNRVEYEERLSTMQQEKANIEKKIEGLVDSLLELGESVAKNHVAKRIETLNQECVELDARIRELEGLTAQHTLSDIEFDMMRQLLTVFKEGIDTMSIEQKRSAIRTLVRKVVWDGVNAHVVLFGIQDEEIEYPDIASLTKQTEAIEENDSEELEQFKDIDYEENDETELNNYIPQISHIKLESKKASSNFDNQETIITNTPKTPWGDHSK